MFKYRHFPFTASAGLKLLSNHTDFQKEQMVLIASRRKCTLESWFRCSRCKRPWPSNRVMVVFHMRLNNTTHQGTIKVRRMRQNCKKCSDAPMETPVIDPDNIDILMETPRPYVGVDVNSPHEPSHCEACIAGVCNMNAGGSANAHG
uniref:3CxxC-type domain-containing protein n=1 Tax=Neogobius melanostomus TaxID=47308 RepID=A0A8C6SAU2_9GOBI